MVLQIYRSLGVFLFLLISTNATIHVSHACEGQELILICNFGEVINVLEGAYGRFNKSICSNFENFNAEEKCGSKHALNNIGTSCNRRRSCKLFVNSANFGDPCPGQTKYAEVYYMCVRGPRNNKKFKHRPHENYYTNQNEIFKRFGSF